MANIDLVIKIPEDEYDIAKYGQYGNINVDIVRKVIANGTPLNEVLDKIKAEIVELWKNEPCAIDGGCLDEMLQIIDKYRGEEDGKID